MTTSYKESFEQIKIAGTLAAKTLDEITSHVVPGVTTNQLDKICYEFIRDNNGYSAPLFYRGFPKTCCTSVNHIVCHGIPTNKYLKEGDIINVRIIGQRFELNDKYISVIATLIEPKAIGAKKT